VKSAKFGISFKNSDGSFEAKQHIWHTRKVAISDALPVAALEDAEFAPAKVAALGEMKQDNGHCAAQGHSK